VQAAAIAVRPWHRRAVHDVELLLCTHPVHANLTPLLDQLTNWNRPLVDRSPLVPALRALATAELAGAAARWTPYYDRGLRAIAAATDDELREPGWGYEPNPRPYDRIAHGRRPLEVHARLCEQLEDALHRGAWTLAAAFERLTIGTDELMIWFGLCPDQPTLDARLRRTALAYLRATRDESPDAELEEALLAAVEANATADEIHERRMRWFGSQPAQPRQCAVGLAITDGLATTYDFTKVPVALIERLGNPFDPAL
jgi:hypothetical protein